MDILTAGDSNYAYTMKKASEAVERHHPDATYYVYDWGLSEDDRQDLERRSNTVVVDWEIRSKTLRERIAIRMSNVDNLASNPVKNRLFKQNGFRERHFRQWQKYLMRQKPLCIRDALERSGDRITFLDADAVLLDNIDDLFEEHDFDVGLTMREKDDLPDSGDAQGLGVPPINAGVLFFDLDSDEGAAFVDRWLAEMDRNDFLLEEQVAIATIAQESNPEIFSDYYRTGSLSVGGHELRFISLPCATYNYYNYDAGISDEQKIVHFKGYDHTEQRYLDMVEEHI